MSKRRTWSARDEDAGPHAGRGPRGYTRSDERIREDVCDRLCEHGFVDASDVEVRVDLAEQISGVCPLHNELRVNDGGQEAGGQSGRPFRAA
jgi:hypothetical protein